MRLVFAPITERQQLFRLIRAAAAPAVDAGICGHNVEMIEPAPNEVLIRVEATPVNPTWTTTKELTDGGRDRHRRLNARRQARR